MRIFSEAEAKGMEARARVDSHVDRTYQNQYILINHNPCLSVRERRHYSWSLGRRKRGLHGLFDTWWEHGSKINKTVGRPGAGVLPPSPPLPPAPLAVGNFSSFGTMSDSNESGLTNNSLLLV